MKFVARGVLLFILLNCVAVKSNLDFDCAFVDSNRESAEIICEKNGKAKSQDRICSSWFSEVFKLANAGTLKVMNSAKN